MKRLNPKTNEPFKRGDVREDGRVFYNYTNTVRGDGFFVERWVKAETISKTKEYDKERKAKTNIRKSNRLPPNYRKICKNKPVLISIFKNAWEIKCDPEKDDEDLMFAIDAFPELIPYFFPEKV